MCGIVGILGTGPVAGSIVAALKRLEYRGYDSAGVGRSKTASSSGKARGAIDQAAEQALIGELVATPGLLAETLKLEPAAEKLAQAIARP
jgi:glucosamine 6-phosphate synthetase-like amidotransferase/phosphosugar isomerase protein